MAQKSGNPRVVWKALTEKAGGDASAMLSTQQFSDAVKFIGTGIQLQACDVQIAFESGDPISFERFNNFCS